MQAIEWVLGIFTIPGIRPMDVETIKTKRPSHDVMIITREVTNAMIHTTRIL